MSQLRAGCFERLFDRVADAIMLVRLTIADLLCEPFPETLEDRIRAERMRRLVEEGRALGLLDEGEDEATLAWHLTQRQLRRR
jgi:hypothetical protein